MKADQALRILYVNSTHKWGGVKTWSLRTAKCLQQDGHQVIIAGRKRDPFLTACQEAQLPVEEITFGASWSPLTIARFVALIRRHKIQLVIGNVGRDLSTAGVAAKICNCPMIHRVGSIYDFRDTLVRRLVHKWLIKAMLLPAKWMIPALKERFTWLAGTDLQASLHSVETTSPFISPALKKISSSSKELTIIFLGRVHPEKGQAELLQALLELEQEGLQPRVQIVGDGPALDSLKEKFEDQFDGRLHFTGFQTKVNPFLDEADIGVLFSKHEAVSNVVFEYLAAGLAIIAPDLPGLREVDPEGKCLTFVDPEKPRTLKTALEHLLRDHQNRQGIQRQSRQLAVECYSPNQEAKRLAQIYRGWINRP